MSVAIKIRRRLSNSNQWEELGRTPPLMKTLLFKYQMAVWRVFAL